MIFENIFLLSALKVLLYTFIGGVICFLVLEVIIWKKNSFLSQYKNVSKIVFSSIVGGLGTSFLLSITICTLTPSLITIESDLSHTEELSFFSNDKFIGIGGSYIANNSNYSLKLIGIGSDEDINTRIKSGSIKKIRKCPESHFQEIPEHQAVSYVKSRGKQKARKGKSVFLVVE